MEASFNFFFACRPKGIRLPSRRTIHIPPGTPPKATTVPSPHRSAHHLAG